ncbi:ferredoxin [Kitasatospora indigofera]|uniref:ferredoxin n=1 Tax=Kitasatospora indigofera TaxID=67307 RepID=UPI0033BD2CA0
MNQIWLGVAAALALPLGLLLIHEWRADDRPAGPPPDWPEGGPAWRRTAGRPEASDPAEVAYWNPLQLIGSPAREVGEGRWGDRSRLNVPGPFYGGATDSGGSGPECAPAHVLHGDEGTEFVYRQPVNPEQLAELEEAFGEELFHGYAGDGDEHWTPDAVREWWAGRAGVRRWIEEDLAGRGGGDNERESLLAFAGYLDDGLEDYLRGYLFWLAEGREPKLGEPLPSL